MWKKADVPLENCPNRPVKNHRIYPETSDWIGVTRPTKGKSKGGIGFQPVKIVLRMTGWKPIPPLFSCASEVSNLRRGFGKGS